MKWRNIGFSKLGIQVKYKFFHVQKVKVKTFVVAV